MSSVPPKKRITIANLLWFHGYLVCMAGVIYALSQYRSNAIVTYGTEDAKTEWQEWRKAADEMGKSGPVERERPESVDPPSLVLMRDHYPACLGISLLLSSCLYVWFMVCARGALRPVSLYDDDLDPKSDGMADSRAKGESS